MIGLDSSNHFVDIYCAHVTICNIHNFTKWKNRRNINFSRIVTRIESSRFVRMQEMFEREYLTQGTGEGLIDEYSNIRITRNVDHRARHIESHCSPLVITTRAEWRDDSGGVKFAINNNDNKLSGEVEYSAASLLNRVSIDGLERRVAIATDNGVLLSSSILSPGSFVEGSS